MGERLPEQGMDIESFRAICLALPNTVEDVKWGNDLCFLIGGRMFAVASLEPSAVVAVFKCTPEDFVSLTERSGIVPAPYLARYHWVGLEHFDAVDEDELSDRVRRSYELVIGKLPASVKKELSK